MGFFMVYSREYQLRDFLTAVSTYKNNKVSLSSRDLRMWDAFLVQKLKKHGLLKKIDAPETMACSGCSENCGGMDVHTQVKRSGEVVSFIMCDVRDDTNRVILSKDDLEWFEMSLDDVVKFFLKSLLS